MNHDQIFATYESVAKVSSQMLTAARIGDWETLCSLESECASQIRTLENFTQLENAVPLTSAMTTRKDALIEKILADDREIRQLTSIWMEKLSSLLNRDRVERQLSMAYGANNL